ncbi:hypothetical protein HOY82DRAFT_615481 [Tuber indicum]|nr:hypothetical protein HOY82DRAFT_615481 [Tuber indicum]
MPNVPPPATTAKEQRKERKTRRQRMRIRELEKLLREQKELTCRDTERARKWKRKCKRARRGVASSQEGKDNLELDGDEPPPPPMVPIVAAVIFQAIYAKVGVAPTRGPQEKRVRWIRNFQEKFWEFGCEKPEEVDSLADLWVRIMQARNTAAQEIRAEDVITVLPHCEATLGGVLERGFKYL